jgi:hypothetical protein
MRKDRGPWQEGRRAWERLNGWHQDSPSAAPGHPDDGPAAVEALADIGQVRRLLDQAELVAVRTARRHGKSWAEIATQLGVTRQSAWERWRDLDDDLANTPSTAASSAPESAPAATTEAAMLDAAASDVVELSARQLRRQSTKLVPNVIGLSWQEARRVLRDSDLVGVSPDADLPEATIDADRVVTDQSPESGANVPGGSSITLWTRPGGGSAGVREPRRPTPAPKSVRELRYEPSDEAIG